MKILVIPVIFFAVSASGQQKEKKLLIPKEDVISKKELDLQSKKKQPENQQNKIYKMPSLKPDDGRYSSLKDKRKDTTDYKMLNSITPQKRSDNK